MSPPFFLLFSLDMFVVLGSSVEYEQMKIFFLVHAFNFLNTTYDYNIIRITLEANANIVLFINNFVIIITIIIAITIIIIS